MSARNFEKTEAVMMSKNKEAIKKLRETGKVDAAYKMIKPPATNSAAA